MRPRLLALPLVMSMVLAAEARAECMAPAPAIFPLGDVVGPRPTLYRFAPRYQADRPVAVVDAAGEPVAFTLTDVSTPGADLRVMRMTVAADGGRFTVRDGAYTARTFEVQPAAPAGPRPLAVEEVTWIEDAWTCSHTRGLAVAFRSEGVVAVRARWSDGFEALVPPSDRAFFHHGAMGGELDPQALRALLGHPNCVENVIPERYIERLDVELWAIYGDGTEQEIPLKRKAAEPAPPPPAPAPAVESTPWVCGTSLLMVQRQREAAAAAARRAKARWLIGGAGLLGALVTVALVLLVRRRRVTAIP